MIPLVNPHRMVTRTMAGFQMPHESLILAAMTTSMPWFAIPTSIHVMLADPN
jgi:hypothetical protein